MLFSLLVIFSLAFTKLVNIKTLILLELLLLTTILISLSEPVFTDLLIVFILVLGACETCVGLSLLLHQ